MFGTPPEPPEPEIPHHFCVDLSPNMHAELVRLVGLAPKTGVTVALKEALELAHRIDLPFTPPVDWTALEKRAMLGYDVVDQIWDAKRKGDAS